MDTTHNTLKVNTMGKGRLPHPEVIRARVKLFCSSKLYCTPDKVSPDWRMVIGWVLKQTAFQPNQIIFILGCSRTTHFRDMQLAQLYVLRDTTKDARLFAERVDKLFSYILYNAKWTL